MLFRLLIFLLLAMPTLFAKEHRVLFISSYHASFPTLDAQMRGIKEALDATQLADISLDIEYLDSKRFNPDIRFEQFASYLGFKLRNAAPYDAILVGDDNALHFVFFYHEKIFKNAPVLFFAINDEELAKNIASHPRFSGVVEKPSIEETLDIIKKLHPKITSIVALSDQTNTGKGISKLFLDHAKESGEVEVSLLDAGEYSFDELARRVSQYDDRKTAFLFLSLFADKEGKRLSFAGAQHFLSQYTQAPIYHLFEHGIGSGFVGGKVVMFSKQARIATDMLLKVLAGEDIADIPLVANSPNSYIFDYNSLQKHEIQLKNLPRDSVVLNKPLEQNILSIYWEELLIVVLAILLFAVMLLSYLYYRANVLAKALEEKQKMLEAFSDSLSEQVEYEVSQRLSSQREIQRQKELLIQQSKMAAMGEMIGAIAHQLKQPLNAISLMAQNIQAELDWLIDDKVVSQAQLIEPLEMCEKIDNQIVYMSQTISDFRNFFLPNKRQLLFMPCETVEEISRIMKDQLIKNSVKVEVHEHQHFQVKGHPNEFKQVVLILLSNAKDVFVEKGKKDGRVDIRIENDGERGYLHFEDNGGGVPTELLPDKLFNAYVSTKGEKGTGIGLQIAKMIIEENMGGRIRVENSSKGARFTIELNLYK